jgi:hypothetical protein
MPPALLAIPAAVATVVGEIAAVGGAVFGPTTGIFAGSSLTIAGVSGSTALSVAAVGFSLGASALSSRQAASAARRGRISGLGSTQKSTIRVALAPRRTAVGRVMLGGIVAFIEAVPLGAPVNSAQMFRLDVLGDGPFDAIENVYIGDVLPVLSGIGAAVAPDAVTWYSPISLSRQPAWQFETALGGLSQPVSPLMASAFPAAFTASAQLKGIAYIAMRMISIPAVDQARIYPQGANTSIRAVVRGRATWDPRLGLNPATNTRWHRSPALAALHVLTATDPQGRPIWYGIPPDLIDTAAFAAAATSDEQMLTLPNGRQRPRWACDAVLSYDAEPRRLIEQVLDTADYQLFLNSAGQITIRGGALWQAPTVHIGPDIITEVIEAERGPSIWERANALRAVYTCPELRYEPQDAAPVTDPDAPAIAGSVIEEPVDLPFVTSHDQARHLAAIALAYKSAGWRLKLRCRLPALALWDEEAVRVTLPELQIAAQSFRILRRELAEDRASITLDVIAWDGPPAAPAYVETPALPPETSAQTLIPVPQSFALTSTGIGGGQANLVATWAAAPSGELPTVFWRAVGAGSWNRFDAPVGATTASIPVPAPLPAGITYEAYLRFVTPVNFLDGLASPTLTRLALADDSLPGPITAVTGGASSLFFTAPTPAPTLFDVQFYTLDPDPPYGPIPTLALPATPGQVFTNINTLGATHATPRNARGEFAPGSVTVI